MYRLNFIRYKTPKNFADIYRKQIALHELRSQDQICDTCLLLEHESVYTSGRNMEESDIYSSNVTVVKTDRGGKITWHGVGQPIAYFIFKLSSLGYSLYKFLLSISSAVISSLSNMGYPYTVFVREYPGLWTFSGKKIASIGLRVSSGVTMHGIAVNCNNSLVHFDKIRPCGIENIAMTSLANELRRDVDKEALYSHIARNIVDQFSFTDVEITYEK